MIFQTICAHDSPIQPQASPDRRPLGPETEIDLDRIGGIDPLNSRKIDPADIDRMAAMLRADGQINPIVVRPGGDGKLLVLSAPGAGAPLRGSRPKAGRAGSTPASSPAKTRRRARSRSPRTSGARICIRSTRLRPSPRSRSRARSRRSRGSWVFRAPGSRQVRARHEALGQGQGRLARGKVRRGKVRSQDRPRLHRGQRPRGDGRRARRP